MRRELMLAVFCLVLALLAVPLWAAQELMRSAWWDIISREWSVSGSDVGSSV